MDIVAAAWSNEAFRRVILTGTHQQVVVMTIPPGAEIGDEAHPDTDQALAFVDGRGGRGSMGSPPISVRTTWSSFRAGTRHNFVNTGDRPLRLITIYAPPEHAPGTVHLTKAEADAAEH